MFTLAVTFKVKSEFVSDFFQALSKVTNLTRLESGNLIYEFSIDESDKTRIFLYEKYRDRAAYEFHVQQEYLQVFRAEIANLLEEAPSVLRGNLQN
jgi:quinol monooxygenase YgiN